jgi:hypothetical protein
VLCECQCGKKKLKTVKLPALPSGAIGKEAFAERSWPLRSAILGTGVPRIAERNGQERSAK